MAYIIGTKRPEAETGQPQQLVAGQPSMIGTQATTGFQAQSGGAPQSTFTNLQRYIEANQGNVSGLVSAVGKQQEQVEQPFQAEKQRAEEAQKQATQAMTGRTQAQTSITGALEKAKTTPTQLTPQEIQNIRNLASTYNYNPAEVGKQLGQSTAILRQQLGEGGAVASGLQALQTPTGVRQALLTQRQAPRASLGGLELDTFLLGATPGAQEQIAQRLAGRAQTLGEQINPLEQTSQAISGTTGLTSKDIQDQLNKALGTFTGEISQTPTISIESPETQFGLDMVRLNKAIQENPTVYNLNTESGRQNIRSLASDYFRTRQQEIGGEQVSRYKAYANLAGLTPEQQSSFLSGSGLTDEEKAARLDQYIKSITPRTQIPIQVVGEAGQPGTITQDQLAVPANRGPASTVPNLIPNLDQALFTFQNIANTIGLNR